MTDTQNLTVVGKTNGKSKRAPKAKATVAIETVTPVSTEIEHADVRAKVLDLRRKAEESYWELSVGLNEVYQNSYYIAWGFGSWKEYVEGELDFQPRKALYLVSIQEWFGKMKPSVRKWVKELGWTKAKELVGVVTNENATQWKRKIEGKSYKEIMDLLAANASASDGKAVDGEVVTSADGTPTKERFTKKAFSLAPAQLENVNTAVQKAQEMLGSDKDGHAIDLICTDFLSTNGGVDSLQSLLSKIERSTGVSLIAYDKNEDAILHGSEVLDAIAESDDE